MYPGSSASLVRNELGAHTELRKESRPKSASPTFRRETETPTPVAAPVSLPLLREGMALRIRIWTRPVHQLAMALAVRGAARVVLLSPANVVIAKIA